MHAVLVLVTVPLIYGAILAVWRRLRRHREWRGLARYTLVTALLGLAFGLGLTPFIRGAYAGLLERISVAIMLQWYVVMGVTLMRIAGNPERRVAGGAAGAHSEHGRGSADPRLPAWAPPRGLPAAGFRRSRDNLATHPTQ